MEQILIYGAGGFGREVAWLAEACADAGKPYQVVGFVDDDASAHGKVLNGIPVLGLEEARMKHPRARMACGVGAPRTRETLMSRAADAGFEFATIVHPRVERSRFLEIGAGTLICAGNILTVNITLGRHVHINIDCTIGHDVVMEDYATLAPGVHVSGWVQLGKRVYVGTGAVLINGTEQAPLIVGDDAVIGAGACVTRAVAPGVTVVGVPAKPR